MGGEVLAKNFATHTFNRKPPMFIAYLTVGQLTKATPVAKIFEL